MPKTSPTEDYREFRFSVTDSGIGMSDEYKNNRLFHSFFLLDHITDGATRIFNTISYNWPRGLSKKKKDICGQWANAHKG